MLADFFAVFFRAVFFLAARFFFGKDGLITSVMGAYLDFYREDFHPWDHDNRHLIDKWKEEHGEGEELAA